MDIRETYRVKRFEKRIRIKELAKHIGCSASQISNFENGHNNFGYDKLMKYVNYIDNKE